MTPADLLLETAALAAKTLPDPAPLLRACRAAAVAVRAAFDHPEEPGGALAMDLERLLGRLAMLASWRPDGPMPNEGELARFVDFARPELAIIAAVNVQRTAEAIISERRAERPRAWPRIHHIQGHCCAIPVREGQPEHAWLRRAAADSRITPDWIDVRDACHRGPYGGLVVTLRYFVPTEPGWEPAGDLGGDGDRKIADVARWVTRKTEPEDVMQALADNPPERRRGDCDACHQPHRLHKLGAQLVLTADGRYLCDTCFSRLEHEARCDVTESPKA